MPHHEQSTTPDQSETKPILSVQVFDADGCIFNPQFMTLKKSTTLLEEQQPQTDILLSSILYSNTTLFTSIKYQIGHEKPEKVIVMCGSNRQSAAIDQERSRMLKTGSFFPVLEKIKSILSKFAPTILDPMLLADLYSGNQAGFAYNKAIDTPESVSHPKVPFDGSKFTLVYAIMHHLAVKYPNYQIHINFYDDTKSILEEIEVWLKSNTSLMPANTAVTLNQYDGKSVTPFDPICAINGETDVNYPETIKMLACLGGLHPNADISACITPPKLRLDANSTTLTKLDSIRMQWSKITRELIPSSCAVIVEREISHEEYTQLSNFEKEAYDLKQEAGLQGKLAQTGRLKEQSRALNNHSRSSESTFSELYLCDGEIFLPTSSPRKDERDEMIPVIIGRQSPSSALSQLFSRHNATANSQATSKSILSLPDANSPNSNTRRSSLHRAPNADLCSKATFRGKINISDSVLNVEIPFVSPTSSCVTPLPSPASGTRDTMFFLNSGIESLESEIDSQHNQDIVTHSRSTST